MATGYVKIWTAMKRNPEFLKMNCLERGAWLQLLLECKDQDDNGYVRAKSVPNLAALLALNRQTCSRLCQKWHDDKIIEVSTLDGMVQILICNYHKWQQATAGEVRGFLLKSSQKSHVPKNKISLPDQTRPNQTKAEQTRAF